MILPSARPLTFILKLKQATFLVCLSDDYAISKQCCYRSVLWGVWACLRSSYLLMCQWMMMRSEMTKTLEAWRNHLDPGSAITLPIGWLSQQSRDLTGCFVLKQPISYLISSFVNWLVLLGMQGVHSSKCSVWLARWWSRRLPSPFECYFACAAIVE